MKIKIALVILLSIISLSLRTQAQVLNGVYKGEAEGSDVNGQILHQLTKWTIHNGNLVAFTEFHCVP